MHWALHGSDDYKNRDRAQLAEELKDPDEYNKYIDTCLNPYVEAKIEACRTGKRRCVVFMCVVFVV